ncbi:hypothetical protein LLG96_19845 [bacterium]|nr:hypothetical protein [bacterium]
MISAWQASKHPIVIGLANLNLLNKKEAMEQLTEYSESLYKMIKCYNELEKFLLMANALLEIFNWQQEEYI